MKAKLRRIRTISRASSVKRSDVAAAVRAVRASREGATELLRDVQMAVEQLDAGRVRSNREAKAEIRKRFGK